MYKLKDVAEILGVSDRTVERYLKSYFSMEKGVTVVLKIKYYVGEEMINQRKYYVGEGIKLYKSNKL
jgi:predicted transcriptional regulator